MRIIMQFQILIFVTLCSLSFAQLSPTTDIEKQLNTEKNKNSLSFVAVFLLTTLAGSTDFGGEGGPRKAFFDRVKASKATWGHPIKHFYGVVGQNDDNVKIISNPSYCKNLTSHYHSHMQHLSESPREEIFECSGIRILYLPYCDHSSWGPMGPCCRCEGAMRYYLNNYAVHSDYPSWYIFADDDYYVRTYKLWGILSRLDPQQSFVAENVPNEHLHVQAGNHEALRNVDNGVYGSNMNCSIPCTSGTSWLAFGLFSVGALKSMEEEIRRNGLIRTCDLLHTTHDVGLGFFAWLFSPEIITMCCGASGMDGGNMERGTFFHEMGRLERGRDHANVMLQKIWKMGADKRGETVPDPTAFMDYEYKEGLNESIERVPNGGFINSIYYRKIQASINIAKQMSTHQLQTLTNFPLRKSDFSTADCNTEMDFYYNWRLQNQDKYPLNPVSSLAKEEMQDTKDKNRQKLGFSRAFSDQVSHLQNHPKICLEYYEAVANYPIKLSDFNLPSLDDLERKKLRRKLI